MVDRHQRLHLIWEIPLKGICELDSCILAVESWKDTPVSSPIDQGYAGNVSKMNRRLHLMSLVLRSRMIRRLGLCSKFNQKILASFPHFTSFNTNARSFKFYIFRLQFFFTFSFIFLLHSFEHFRSFCVSWYSFWKILYSINESTVEEFRKTFFIPPWITIECAEIPKDCNNVEGSTGFTLSVAEGGITSPPNQLFLKFCEFFDVNFSMWFLPVCPKHLVNYKRCS